jgi:hypothetical protein
MWEPVGPLPAAVYWRRRWVALATVLTVVGLVTVAVGGRPPTVRPTPTPTPAAVQATAEGRPDLALGSGAVPTGPLPAAPATRPGVERSDTVAPSAAGATTAESGPGSSTPSAPASAVHGSASATASTSAQAAPGTTAEQIRPDDTPRPTVAAQAPVPVPRTGPVPCTNAMLTAGAEIDPAVHKVGSRPVLRLVITNVSGQPCVRDLDAARQEIVVWSGDGATRLWSSNDCVNNPTVDLRTLVPGRPVAFALTWGERTTTPGCGRARTVVPAGSYRLMVRLDDLISPPTPFLRTP